MVFNGALLGGRVADPSQRDAATIAIRTLVNDTRDDERIRPLLVPVGDGVLVAQKKLRPGDRVVRRDPGRRR